MLVLEPDTAQALRQAVAERQVEVVRAFLTEVPPDRAIVVLDEFTVEQADLVDLLSADELRNLLLRSTADDDIAEGVDNLECGLGSRLNRAVRFYALLTVSTLAAAAMNYLGINVIDALFWSSVINGVLAAPLLVLMLFVANNRAVIGHRVNGPGLNVLVGLAAAVMCAAAIGLFIGGA